MGRRDRLDPAALTDHAAVRELRARAVAVSHRLREEWWATRAYRLSLQQPAPEGLAATPREFRPANAERGLAILGGRFALAGAVMEVEPPGDPWNRTSPSWLFAVQLHRLAPARDLLSAGEPGARELLRLFLTWRDLFPPVSAFAWGPETLERRVFNLACSLRPLMELASTSEAEELLASLAAQARHLAAAGGGPAREAERLCCVAVAGCALAGAAGERLLAHALTRLSSALQAAVLPDGGMKTRSPEQGLELLFDLLTLDDALLQRGREAPVELARSIDRLTGATRFFTLGDGSLAAFHGGEAAPASVIAAACAHDEEGGRPFGFAPQSGYHRLIGRGLQVIVDAAPPAQGGWSITACAQPLAIEVTAGPDRLFANAGWSPNAAGPQSLRLTAAGCTAALGDQSAGQPLTGELAKALGPRLVDAAVKVEARRNEAEGGVWLELSHDGWAARFGLLHERRLFVDTAGDELRGEDRFTPAGEGASTAAEAPIYAVRFHLHPEVEVGLARDGRSVLLRGGSGHGWWFRNDAQEVTLEPSAVFQAGQARRTAQIVLRGHATMDGAARVRWKLTRAEPE